MLSSEEKLRGPVPEGDHDGVQFDHRLQDHIVCPGETKISYFNPKTPSLTIE